MIEPVSNPPYFNLKIRLLNIKNRGLEGLKLAFLFISALTQLRALAEPMPPHFVDLSVFIPNIQIDLKYATRDNFTGEVLYDSHKCLLLREAAVALRAVQAELESRGLGLRVWDGFRTMSAQRKMWELVPDERYVSDPKKGGRHTRGTAVDVTLVTKEGTALPMPSDFDDFTEKAHPDDLGAADAEIANRELLRAVMEKHGFIGLKTEWWHYDWADWRNYPPVQD